MKGHSISQIVMGRQRLQSIRLNVVTSEPLLGDGERHSSSEGSSQNAVKFGPPSLAPWPSSCKLLMKIIQMRQVFMVFIAFYWAFRQISRDSSEEILTSGRCRSTLLSPSTSFVIPYSSAKYPHALMFLVIALFTRATLGRLPLPQPLRRATLNVA